MDTSENLNTNLKEDKPLDSPQRPSEISLIQHSAIFSGPLPPPAILEKYNQLVPDAAERILTMAEGQSSHRQQMESAVVVGGIRSHTRSSWFSFIISILVIGLGFTLVEQGKDAQGLVAILGTLAALVGSFLYSSNAQRKNLAQTKATLRNRRTR